MEINEFLIAERVAKEANKRHRKELNAVADQFEEQFPDDWSERLENWDLEHPFSSFVRAVYLEYVEVARLIRDLESPPPAREPETPSGA